MRRITPGLLLLLLLLLALGLAPLGCATTRSTPPPPEIVGGVWDVVVEDTPEGDLEGVLTVTPIADELTGEAVFPALGPPEPLEEVSYEDGQLAFSVTFELGGLPTLFLGTATLDGDRIEGQIEIPDAGSYDFAGTRATE